VVPTSIPGWSVVRSELIFSILNNILAILTLNLRLITQNSLESTLTPRLVPIPCDGIPEVESNWTPRKDMVSFGIFFGQNYQRYSFLHIRHFQQGGFSLTEKNIAKSISRTVSVQKAFLDGVQFDSTSGIRPVVKRSGMPLLNS
jgi:hypothetical protein